MICFCWCGFPQYGARCVKGFVDTHCDEDIIVVATKPKVPIQGMEKLSGCPVYWIDSQRGIDEQLPWLNIQNIRVLFLDGWCCKPFNDMANRVRRGAGKVICMVDNNLQYHQFLGMRIISFLEVLKAIRFRLLLRWRYDGYFVPGIAGVKLMKYYGVPLSKVRRGFYAADEMLFHNGNGLNKRERKVIYVGQFCDRKNVLRMVKAFMSAKGCEDWRLELYGNGPLRDKIEELSERSNGHVKVFDFLQPEQLAEKYREARVFCLASVEEHWGLVVHEAALSGCALCVSNRVGAGEDFISNANGRLFNPYSQEEMAAAFSELFSWSDEQFSVAQVESLKLADNASISEFARNAGEWLK